MGWMRNSRATSGFDQNVRLALGISACAPATRQSTTETKALATPSGRSSGNFTPTPAKPSVISGSVTTTCHSKLVMSIRNIEGGGV